MNVYSRSWRRLHASGSVGWRAGWRTWCPVDLGSVRPAAFQTVGASSWRYVRRVEPLVEWRRPGCLAAGRAGVARQAGGAGRVWECPVLQKSWIRASGWDRGTHSEFGPMNPQSFGKMGNQVTLSLSASLSLTKCPLIMASWSFSALSCP